MPVDLHSNAINNGTVSGPLFSTADGNGTASSGVSAPAAALHLGTARGTSSGPAGTIRYSVLKRLFDLFLVLLSTPVLVPLVFAIAAAVRISSPGPVFFSHRRIRGHGVFFTMWKFRTMCVNSAEILERHLAENPEAREEWHLTHKLKNDPRVTSVGAFLRRTSLDELPQLWNVFTGSMSLVGPRPIVAAEVEKYGECFSSYCMVKPGITGLWQISGRSRTTYTERIHLDRRYVQRWTFWGDVVILARTLVSVVGMEGAY